MLRRLWQLLIALFRMKRHAPDVTDSLLSKTVTDSLLSKMQHRAQEFRKLEQTLDDSDTRAEQELAALERRLGLNWKRGDGGDTDDLLGGMGGAPRPVPVKPLPHVLTARDAKTLPDRTPDDPRAY